MRTMCIPLRWRGSKGKSYLLIRIRFCADMVGGGQTVDVIVMNCGFSIRCDGI